MVKGISKQVIVVQSPDPELFEQAIFILKESAVNADRITEERLLKEAKCIVASRRNRSRNLYWPAFIWSAAGAFATGLVWLITCAF